MEQSVQFTEAIRMVHPDANKNVADAGTKVRTIMTFKDDPRKMFLFLRKWELLPSRFKNIKKTYRKTENMNPRFTIIRNLVRNMNYNGRNVYVCITRDPSYAFEVLRTTKKRVYFHTNAYGQKYCHIDSVVRAWSLNI